LSRNIITFLDIKHVEQTRSEKGFSLISSSIIREETEQAYEKKWQ